MSVKANQSAMRVLDVLEAVAEHQPVGLGDLARLLDADKNAVHRALVTLSHSGWIAPVSGTARGWELTGHIFVVAGKSQRRNDLRLRARDELDVLRDETGETALLTIPGRGQFIVADVFESRQVLRTAPAIGTVIKPVGSATGYALLPYLTADARRAMIGGEPDAALVRKFEETLRQGYAVAVNTPIVGITVIAAPVFDASGAAVAAISVVGPTERVPKGLYSRLGTLLARAAERLSRAQPAVVWSSDADSGAPPRRVRA